MKKLFLYVLLFVGIFSLCFLLANEYFKQRMQEKEGQKLELAADSISIDTEWKDNGFLVGIQSGRVQIRNRCMNILILMRRSCRSYIRVYIRIS